VDPQYHEGDPGAVHRAVATTGETAVQNAYIVTGSLTDERTLKLDEALPVQAGKVRVTVEVLPTEPGPTLDEVLERIHRGQHERGFVPPAREEVDAYLNAERDSWDDQ
jgi:hypothetical protein